MSNHTKHRAVMADAYVNVIVQAGAVSDVAREIDGLDSVAAAHLVTGDFDIVAQLDLDSKEDIPRVVTDEIHAIDGVRDTITNVAFEP